MHPLFHFRRLGLYLLAWLPLTATSIYAVVSRGTLDWLTATALVVPIFLFYALLCLSAWYPCRGTPLGKVSFTRLLLTHLVAAWLISFMWIELSAALTYAALSPEKFEAIKRQFTPQVPEIYTVAILLYLLSVALHYVLISIEESRAAQARAMETSMLAREAELKALKAQINPHFLFNSLNSISALTTLDPTKAREMCILLADFLRLTLGLGERALVPLREELELLQRFLAVEKVRFGERLRFDAYADAEAQVCLVPPLILQPLIENAVIHGIANLPEGGTVRVSADCSGGSVHLSIDNSIDPDAPPARKGGVGLANVRQRLEARYGKDATLRTSIVNDHFRVWLVIPAETADLQGTAPDGEAALAKEARS